jgi:hypothetical protein
MKNELLFWKYLALIMSPMMGIFAMGFALGLRVGWQEITALEEDLQKAQKERLR